MARAAAAAAAAAATAASSSNEVVFVRAAPHLRGRAPTAIFEGHFASLLETFKADGYALEHRFYGRSLPQPTAEADNLRWLTAEQLIWWRVKCSSTAAAGAAAAVATTARTGAADVAATNAAAGAATVAATTAVAAAATLTLSWRALADLAFFIENRRRERAAAQGTSPQAIPVVVCCSSSSSSTKSSSAKSSSSSRRGSSGARFWSTAQRALAAFARVKYPALISGSISSSSPVLAKEKFVSFDRKVQQGLPDSCRAAAAAAVAALNRNVTLGHMEEELRRFDCPDIPSQTDADKVAFVYSVVDTLSEAVQYERPVVRPLVELLCNFLGSPPASSKEATKKVEEVAPAPAETASRGSEAAGSAAMKGNLEAGIGSQPQLDETHSSGEGAAETAAEDREEALLNGLASYFQAALKRKSASCKEVNILAAKNTALDGSVLSSTRLWMWQSCAQFGFWQTRDSRLWWIQCCLLVLKGADCCQLATQASCLWAADGGRFADQGIRETNLWSGGRHLADMHAATNIHFTNGEKDPWSTLSVLDVQSQVQDSQHISAFVIEGRCVFLQGGSHCTDFYGPTAQDSKSLQLGRAAIAAAVEGFIARHRESLSDAHAVETPQHQDDGSRGGALLRPQEGETKKPSTSEL
ncbi:hypothetical protein ACSSS7_001783 [Eimeria intestinalis]